MLRKKVYVRRDIFYVRRDIFYVAARFTGQRIIPVGGGNVKRIVLPV